MNQTIITTGDGNILNTGNSVKIEASISIKKGDKASLKKMLIEQSVVEKDANELIQIIDSEKPDKTSGKFGSKVNSWVQKMVGKALDGSWQIGVGAAGDLLAGAIQSYYGMK